MLMQTCSTLDHTASNLSKPPEVACAWSAPVCHHLMSFTDAACLSDHGSHAPRTQPCTPFPPLSDHILVSTSG